MSAAVVRLPRLVDSEPEPEPAREPFRPSMAVPERLDERHYDSGHVWRCRRAHVEMVLAARARLGVGEGVRR